MKIIKMTAENIKGIKAIEITPSGNVVEISGKNGAGKSSVLDAIWLALGGKEAQKDVTAALRKGAESGYVDLDLGTLKVRRTYTAEGTTKLTVKTVSEGVEATVGAGQTTLDALRAITLDPQGFINMPAREQRQALLGLLDLDIDLDEWERTRKAIFEERTDIGRQAKSLGDVPAIDDDLPKIEQSAAEIITEIREAEEANRQRANLQVKVNELGDESARIQAQIHDLQQRQAALEADRATAQKRLADMPERIDTAPLEASLATVEETNAKIRVNSAAKALLERKVDLKTLYDAKTEALEAHDRDKEQALAKAKVPVDGLSIEEDYITLGGVPFQDVNSGQQIETAVRIIAALKPRLRIVHIRNASLLDDEAWERVDALAGELDLQVWAESVGDGHGDAIVIEAGEVA